MEAVRAELGAAIDDQIAKLSALLEAEVPRFNELASDQGVGALIAPSKN
jgi:hypothetical protein